MQIRQPMQNALVQCLAHSKRSINSFVGLTIINVYCMPGTVLGARDIGESKKKRNQKVNK